MASSPSQPAARPGAPADLPAAIRVRDVRRTYDAKPQDVVALAGVDLDVAAGEFFGLLGPNGAGKTTLIKIMTTLLLPSSGTATVFGFDVERQTKQLRRIMNMVAGGEQSGYGILTVREQLWMFSQFYGLPRKDGWARVDELIEAVGLHDQRVQRVSTLSTGQRQKMNMARGLLNDPWILFLDEPTLGLDVSAARQIRRLVVDWQAAVPGRTILLTTHDMAEADTLCERVAIVDHGRILAIGTPAELKRRVRRESIVRLELESLDGGPPVLRELPGVVRATAAADQPKADQGHVHVNLVLEADDALGPVVAALGRLGVRLVALRTSEPTLEDVFVELVGRGFAETERAAAEDSGARAERAADAGRQPDHEVSNEPPPEMPEPAAGESGEVRR